MGAHVRQLQAEKYREIIKHLNGIPGVPSDKLYAIIKGYDKGGVACDDAGVPQFDADGEEMGKLAYAVSKLTPDEYRAFEEFNESLWNQTHPRWKELEKLIDGDLDDILLDLP